MWFLCILFVFELWINTSCKNNQSRFFYSWVYPWLHGSQKVMTGAFASINNKKDRLHFYFALQSNFLLVCWLKLSSYWLWTATTMAGFIISTWLRIENIITIDNKEEKYRKNRNESPWSHISWLYSISVNQQWKL